MNTVFVCLLFSLAQLLPMSGGDWHSVETAITTTTRTQLKEKHNLAEGLNASDPYFIEKQMGRFATLAAVNGPLKIDTNVSYTKNQSLAQYIKDVQKKRSTNPALWRGKAAFQTLKVADANCLIVTKKDSTTGNKVIIVYSDKDTTVPVHGYGGVDTDAYRPEVIVVNPVTNIKLMR